ncbi:hypothetical protein [Ralstonia pseudosolanacearum]|nr:hypothetical protein [Ralstonia pseudosolanacearum]
MKVHVTPLFSKGILKQKWMCAMGNARGVLFLNSKHDNLTRRTTRVAELQQVEDGRGGRKWELFDVQLVWAKDSLFLLSGYERRIEGIDTAVNFLQAWLVRFPTPGEMGIPASPASEAVAPTDAQIEEAITEASV